MISNLFEKFLSLFSSKVFASSLSGALSDTLNEDTLNSISDDKTFVQWIIDISIPLGITCAFVLLVYAGYMMVTSQGNPDKLKESRDVITNAVIGFVVIMLSVTLLYLIKDSLGLDF
jgi:magnesium-transporting ATPase (P-type)